MKKKTVKKAATINIMTTKKKRIDSANWKRNRKKKTSTDNEYKIVKENQKNYKKRKSEPVKLKWFFNQNLMLFLTSAIVKKKLKKKTKWTKSIENLTKILKKSYKVLMHEIRV